MVVLARCSSVLFVDSVASVMLCPSVVCGPSPESERTCHVKLSRCRIASLIPFDLSSDIVVVLWTRRRVVGFQLRLVAHCTF